MAVGEWLQETIVVAPGILEWKTADFPCKCRPPFPPFALLSYSVRVKKEEVLKLRLVSCTELQPVKLKIIIKKGLAPHCS